MQDILEIICKAAGQVTQNYFKLTTTYEPSGIVRERVFCYELYHQLRLVLGNNHRLTLNGEIDKRGHRDFKEEDRKNPDFVFHIPGEHKGNTIIFEVKGNLDVEGITKDFDTMTTFVSSYQYQAGVFLLYNHTLNELVKALGNKFDRYLNSKIADKLFVVTLPKEHSLELVTSFKKLQQNK
ncbi:MAG TPA: hypothetical protein PL084_11235 [Chitinophagales bacterium]|nr:hypothetical protein [Chitinophagales bacterium]HRP39100.1 hypothetical protein [Chitinophagales bacterium]